MNNYQNPYYMPYSYNHMAQPIQQQLQQYNQQMQKPLSYDFYGNYVKSYEEAKNAPYTDRPTLFLDTDNDKLYIKKINDKGVPEIGVYSVVIPKEEKKEETNLKLDLEILKDNFDNKIKSLEDEIRTLKSKGAK